MSGNTNETRGRRFARQNVKENIQIHGGHGAAPHGHGEHGAPRKTIFGILFVGFFGASAGIIHKANFIHIAAGGDYIQGLIALLIGSAVIIFGSIALYQLIKRTSHAGLISVFEQHVGAPCASGFGWFNTFVVLPAFVAVLSWVAGTFTLNVFGVLSTDVPEIVPFLIGMGYTVVIFFINFISHKLAFRIQRFTTLFKYIPFAIIIVIGIIYSLTGGESDMINPLHAAEAELGAHEGIFGWLPALAPVAFCMEGWFLTSTLAKHSRAKKQNVALVIGAVLICVIYILYYTGVAAFSLELLETGNNHLYNIAAEFAGGVFGRIIAALGVVAIIGAVDTCIMGLIHMPTVLSMKNYIHVTWFNHKEGKHDPQPLSALLAFVLIILYTMFHYFAEEYHLFYIHGRGVESDIAECALIISFALLIVLYYKLIRGYFAEDKAQRKGFFPRVICPAIAICGTVLLVFGGVFNNPVSYAVTMAACAVIFILAGLSYRKGTLDREADDYIDKYIE